MAQGLVNESIKENKKPRNRNRILTKKASQVSGRKNGLFNKSLAVQTQKEKNSPHTEQSTGILKT